MAPRLHSESADLELAEQVHGVIAAMRDFLRGAIDAPGLSRFARDMWPEARQDLPFAGQSLANTVWLSILNATDPELRITDVEGYIRWLTIGSPFYPIRVCGVRMSAARLAAQLSLATHRYIVDGLGWQESVEFVSLVTGRQFHAESSIVHDVPDNIFVHACDVPGREPQPLLDLCNTLGIDAADCFLDHAEPARWRIWRQDDNGHRSVVSTFTALKKARLALADLEAATHKQMYWIDPFPAGDAG